jgi:hypothetical protein
MPENERKVQEVEAEVIDAPAMLSGADRWLATERARVAEIAKEYQPHQIDSYEDHDQSKRDRAAARKAIKRVEDERRAQVGAIKDAVRDFEGQVRDLLKPLSEIDEGYREAIESFERTDADTRNQKLEAWYQETQGDVARLVPFATLWARYATQYKWANYSKKYAAQQAEVQQAVAEMEHDLATIESLANTPQERADVKSEYLRTLDLSAALRSAADAAERRERMARVEREREERVAEAERMARESQQEPIPGVGAQDAGERREEPQTAQETPQDAPQVARFVVEVPWGHRHDFADAMRRLGWAHGHLIH